MSQRGWAPTQRTLVCAKIFFFIMLNTVWSKSLFYEVQTWRYPEAVQKPTLIDISRIPWGGLVCSIVPMGSGNCTKRQWCGLKTKNVTSTPPSEKCDLCLKLLGLILGLSLVSLGIRNFLAKGREDLLTFYLRTKNQRIICYYYYYLAVFNARRDPQLRGVAELTASQTTKSTFMRL